MLSEQRSFLDDDIRAWQHQNLDRLEAEYGGELPELSDATLAERARRLLDCPIAFDDDDDEFLRGLATSN